MSRLLVIMGSGETSPTMVATHREIFSRVGPGPAVLLDTPYGFQENADNISARAVEYFRQSTGRAVDVLRLRDNTTIVESERMLDRLRQAVWAFAGPGSPSYALSVWRSTIVPGLLADKLRTLGAVVFASAAALTLGRFTVPVYEIYKAGARPFWLEGLDILSEAGLCAVVIPHFNNAEGGGHDTRYCFLGEPRLRVLEEQLPAEAFILGVDEHTSCCLDLDERTATITGLGAVTVRRHGRPTMFASGTTVTMDDLVGTTFAGERGTGPPAQVVSEARESRRSPLSTDVARLESAFGRAMDAGKAEDAVAAVLDLDQLLLDWSRDTLESDELDRARSALRALVVRLGEAAGQRLRDRGDVIGPFVETLLDLRQRLRQDQHFDLADAVRDRLVELGIEVRDTASGTEWHRPTQTTL